MTARLERAYVTFFASMCKIYRLYMSIRVDLPTDLMINKLVFSTSIIMCIRTRLD